MNTGQPVDEWVARLARPTDTQVQAWKLAAALDGLPVAVHDASAAAARVPRTPRAAKRRRRIIATAAVTATLGAASVGVAAAAGAFGAHTGLFGSPGMTENDTSEYLDLNAPDF